MQVELALNPKTPAGEEQKEKIYTDSIQQRYRYKGENTLYYFWEQKLYLFNHNKKRFVKHILDAPIQY